MIQKTDDLSIFKKSKFNTDIDNLNLKKIILSIKSKNMLELRPILVNSLMEVIDGQHRLEACKHLGLPIFYTISEEVRDEDMILLNNNQRCWRLKDYVNFHAKKGKSSYIKIIDMCEKYELPVEHLICVIGRNSTKERRRIKEGTIDWDLNPLEIEIREAKQNIDRVLSYLDQKMFGNKYYFKGQAIRVGLIKLMQSKLFNMDIFIQKLDFGISRVHACSKVKDYYEMFRSIYNFRNHDPIEAV